MCVCVGGTGINLPDFFFFSSFIKSPLWFLYLGEKIVRFKVQVLTCLDKYVCDDPFSGFEYLPPI